jgi:hypothetical protein
MKHQLAVSRLRSLKTLLLRKQVTMLRLFLALPLLVCLQVPTCADVITLYDGVGLPAEQPWLVYADDGFLSEGTASQVVVPAGVQLRTDNRVRGGYSTHSFFGIRKNNAFPVLDREAGFELAFTARLFSEQHSSANRAGFSVILLGSDSRGIELGFWQDEIWAQTSAFSHGAGYELDTTLERDYRLRILGDQYFLSEGGSPILSGQLQSYGAPAVPYQLPNYLFLGDNTGSAGASVALGAIGLTTGLAAVPEPGGLWLIAVSSLWVATRRRRPR